MGLFVDSISKRRSIVIRSIVKDRMIICYPVNDPITLTAELNDITNLRNLAQNPDNGYEMEWEQVEGDPVTITDPTALSTDYPFTESSDKRFRFWLEKGTPRQRYLETRVWHTPTSYTNNPPMLGMQRPISTVDNAYAAGSRLTGFIIPDTEGVFKASVPGIPAEIISLVNNVEAGLETYTVKLEVLRSETPTHNPTAIDQSFDMGSYPAEIYVSGGYYKLRNHYLINGQAKYYDSDLIIVAPVDPSSPVSITDEVAPAPTFSVQNHLTNLIRFTTTIKLIIDAAGNSSLGAVGATNIVRSTFIQYPTTGWLEELTSPASLGADLGIQNFNRQNLSGIGTPT